MSDQDKAKQQLVEELAELRRRIATLEGIDAERRRAEEELRESEGRYRALAESTRDIIYILDRQGTLLYANQAASQCINIRADEIVGKRQTDLFPPEMAQVHAGKIGCVLATGEVLEEDELFHFGPEEVWLRIHLVPLRNTAGQITSVMGVCHNITDRKRTEEALQKANDELERRVEERTAALTKANEELAIFQKFAETSGQGFSMADLDGHLIYLNPALCRMLGAERAEDRIGQHLSICYSEETNRRGKREIEPALKRQGYWEGELPMLSRQGKPVPTWHNTFIIRDESGNPLRMAVVVTDITERKRAEETLAESEAKYRLLVETTDTGYLILDEDGRVVDANVEYVRLTGHQNLGEIMDRKVKEWTASYDAERNAQEVQKCLQEGAVRQLEVDYVAPDGKVTPIEINASVIETTQGRRIVSLCRNITERKRAEEELRQSRDELRAIYDGMQDGLLMADIETQHFVRVNASICRILGYSEDELLSLSVRDIHPEAGLPFVVEQFQALAEGTLSVSEEIPVLRKDGTVFYAVVGVSRVTYSGRRCVVGFFRDVTERRQAQQALRQSHDELQAIYEQVVDGIIVVDAETGNPVRANAAYYRMMGYSEDEVMTLSPERVHPSEVLPLVREHHDAVKKGNVARIDDLPFLRKNGGLVYADVVSSRILYNERPGWISFFHDVTERKQAQDALERERQSLWRMLQASDHERQIISYEIHDGLAQYLAAATMQFQAHDILRENSPQEARKAYQTALQLVRQAHSESRRLISEVRPPVIDEVGLETAISHLVHEQRRRGGPKIQCHSDVQFGRLPSILENAIYRIVQEALTNACKHSKSEKVTVSMTQEGEDVQLEVRDWGIGFDPESVEEGHFGLEGIRQRVRLLGGRLTIETTPGSGALVRVVVPILERQNGG
jgi:PAS domain S-box-containing protein